MIKLKHDGYVYISDSGVEYDLLKGKSLGADTTSDIIFICFLSGDCDIKDEVVGFLYGATFFEEDIEEYNNHIKKIVDKYERKNAKLTLFRAGKLKNI